MPDNETTVAMQETVSPQPPDLVDYFAGKALSGIVANPTYDGNVMSAVRRAYESARHMVAHRESWRPVDTEGEVGYA